MKILIAAAAMASLAAAAEAATVTVTKGLDAAQTAAATDAVLAPTTITGDSFLDATGSVSGVRRSPYDTIPALAATGKYHSVQGGGSMTYAFDGLQDGFTLLWGSPDTYNALAFFEGATQIDLGAFGMSLTGDEVAALGQISPLGQNFGVVSVSGILFDRVVLSSGSNAFEFGLVSASPAPVPLPAAAWMLIAGLGALAAAGRRRA